MTSFFLACSFLLLQVSTSFVNMQITPASSHQNNLFAKGNGESDSHLGILSFDLDDTLFHTTNVVRAANEKMIQTMIEQGCNDAALPVFLETTKSIRKTLEKPLTYQALRKRAIRQTFVTSQAFHSLQSTSDIDLDALVDICYNAWESERHEAAERFLFPNAVETMTELRKVYPNTCFAAITNGAGDPLKMPNTLAPFFDFRISGEDEEIFPNRKPHSYIYEYALQKYKEDEKFGSGAWCHVGDCLANDVGASAACGASAIWMCLEDDPESAASRLVDSKNHPEWSTAPKEEIDRRKKKVDEGKKSVAATIYELSELPNAISLVLQQSYSK